MAERVEPSIAASMPAAPERREEPIGRLLKSLRDDTQKLVRDEIALARAEMQEKVDEARRRAVGFAIGLALLIAGLFEILYALTRGLIGWFDNGMSFDLAVWLAPTALAVILLTVGYALVRGGATGVKKTATTPPEHTMHSLRKDRDWVREQVKHRT